MYRLDFIGSRYGGVKRNRVKQRERIRGGNGKMQEYKMGLQ